MNSVALFTAPTFQFAAGWQPDALSLGLGLLLGVGLGLLVQRALPHLQRLRDRSLNRVQETHRWVRAGVERRFQAETAAYVRGSHLGGPRAALEEIFVEPRLLAPPALVDPAAGPAGAESPDADAVPHTGELLYLWPQEAAAVALPPPPTMSLRQLLLNGRRVLLSSPSGWGKSTLLAYCAYLCATADENEAYTFLLPYVPVLLHLSELDLMAEGVEQDPAQPAATLLQQRAGPLTAPGIAALLREKLEAGHVLLLLDGWDELIVDGQAPALAWLTALLERYPQIRTFIAAPEQGYEPLQALTFTVSGIAPWRAQQAIQLGERWADRLQRSSPPRLDSYWQPHQSPLATTLRLWHVCDPQGVKVEAESLTSLLDQSLGLLLQQSNIDEEQNQAVREFWQQLAYLTLTQNADCAPVTTVQQTAEMVARRQPDGLQAGALRSSLTGSGLFIENADRSVRPRSPLWRDFLAAAHMAQKQEEPPIPANLDDVRWRHAIRFYVGCAGADGLAARLLDSGRSEPFYEPLFALGAWLAETHEQGTWRRRTMVELGQLVVRPAIPRVVRQRAVAALAACGESGVLALLQQLLQRSDAELRQMAVAAIARFDPEQSVPLLEQMLRDGDAGVRIAAIHALGWQYNPLAERPLLEALIGRDDGMRRAAVEQLALNGGTHWQILQEAAEDEDLHVRRAATAGLQALDEGWAEQRLQQMALEDEEWIVKSAASLALEARAAREQASPWRPADAADLAWMVEWAAERDQAAPGGPAAVTMLCELLATAPETHIRVAAARALAQVHVYPEQRQSVWSSLQQAQQNDANGSVREAAFTTMARLNRARGRRKT